MKLAKLMAVRLFEVYASDGPPPPPRRPVTPPPAPPPEPPKPEFADTIFEPTAESIALRMTCNGGDAALARASLLGETRARLDRLARTMPEEAAAIGKGLHAAERERVKLLTKTDTLSARVNVATELLQDRAGTRRETRDVQADLAAATTALDSPESVKLDPGTLALLAQKVKHLPTKVQELKAREAELTAQLAALDGIDTARLVKVLATEAARDSDLWKLLQTGFLKAE